MADQKLTALVEDTTPLDTDIVYGVKDPAGTPLSKKITWASVKTFLKTYFDSVAQTLTNKTLNSNTNYIDADATHMKVVLALGRAGVVGDPVYISAWNVTNSCPEVSLARANSASTLPCAGVLESAGADGTVQSMRIEGILQNVNTNAWSTGARLYVSAATAGVLTSTRPTTPNYDQAVATVLYQSATVGILDVIRTAFVGTMAYGDTASYAPIRPATTKTTLVDADEVTGNDSEATFGQIKTTWTNVKAFLANYFATLGTAQTFTQVKKFTKDCLSVLGTGAGWNNITTENTSGTSYNNILPAKDGTFAMTSDIVGGSALWTAPTGATRVGNTSFTVTGDQTATFAKGVIIKWTESGTVRTGMVDRPSTVSTNTTVTIIGDTMASIDASSLKYCMLGAEMFKKRFAYAGNLGAVTTGIANVITATEPCRLLGADLWVGTAGTTNSTTFDININGTTAFTTKPTLASTVQSAPYPFTADTNKSLALGDDLTLDLDAYQTTNAIDGFVDVILFPTRYLNLA